MASIGASSEADRNAMRLRFDSNFIFFFGNSVYLFCLLLLVWRQNSQLSGKVSSFLEFREVSVLDLQVYIYIYYFK